MRGSGRFRSDPTSGMGPYEANRGSQARAANLGQSGRSRSNPYGGYSDTEVTGISASDRYYRDPYHDHPDSRYHHHSGGYYDDTGRRGGYGAGVLDDERVRRPPPPPRPSMQSRGYTDHHSEFIDSDMESVTSAFSSQSAPHARARRSG